MAAIVALALNTFRETVRDKIIYSFVLFAIVITLVAILLGSLSVGQDMRILEDLGLSAIAVIGGIIAVFAGTNLVYKELERKTIYIIFTKPVKGWQFIAGKYIGLSICVLAVVVAMGLFLSMLIWVVHPNGAPFTLTTALFEMIPPVALIYLELLFVIAMATFFSTFSSPVMSVLFTLALWLIGHLGDSLRQLGQLSQNPAFARLSQAVYFTLPDLA
ncbi:MAG TPA: ABC transporter permease subunit, partial [Chroococcales cyanobacterium]